MPFEHVSLSPPAWLRPDLRAFTTRTEGFRGFGGRVSNFQFYTATRPGTPCTFLEARISESRWRDRDVRGVFGVTSDTR